MTQHIETLSAPEHEVPSLTLAVQQLTERLFRMEENLELTDKMVDEVEDRVENIATYLKARHGKKSASKAQESESKGIFCANCSGPRNDPNRERVYHADLAEARAAHTN